MKIYILLLVACLLAGAVFASDNSNSTTGDSGSKDWNSMNFNEKKAVCDQSGIFSDKVFACIPVTIIGSVFGAIQSLFNALASLIESLFTMPFNIHCIAYDKYLASKDLISGLYSLLIALVGIYWVFGAHDQQGRITAKFWTERLIVIILAQAMGAMLFETALDLNRYITSSFLDASIVKSMLTVTPDGGAGGAVSTLMLLLIMIGNAGSFTLTLLTLIARIVLLVIMYILFPFILFLYLLPATKQIGRVALVMTLLVIFLGSLDAFMLFGGDAVIGVLDKLPMLGMVIRPFVIASIFGAIGALNIHLFLAAPTFVVPDVSAVLRVLPIASKVSNRAVPTVSSHIGDAASKARINTQVAVFRTDLALKRALRPKEN